MTQKSVEIENFELFNENSDPKKIIQYEKDKVNLALLD